MALIELDLNPTRRALRWFGALWFPGFFAIVGAIVLHGTGSLAAAGITWGGALLIAAAGLLSPRFMRVVYVGWMRAVYPIGWLISHLMLAVTFYLVITPIGLLMRLVRRDALKLRSGGSGPTYWTPYEPDERASRYFQQF